ncbi:MAG TPA: glycosyl hydrolase [Candidatus Angelobacter sp.]|nr:glycosyl hydrolase [Candidatus Angelobacter sp.]
MIFRSRVVYFLLIVFSSFSFAQSLFTQSLFAQSTQTKPQTSENKRVKTSATGKLAKPPAAKSTALPIPATANTPIDEKAFGAMRWRQVGPFRGGRVLAVTGVPGEPNVFYFGAVAGGVWKSTDSGVNWQPIFDKEPIASIGAIAVAPSDHNVIYVGTGEACIRGNITYGDGVYKSVDGGKTWKNLGLKDTRHIGAVIIDSKDPNIVMVAALGHAYGQNEERGVFRTTDGGATWQKVLYKDNKTGAIDVVFDPHNPNTVFASLWEVYRTPWSLNSGGPGSGIYKSTDEGATWTRIEGHGLPPGIMGRIGISVSGADSSKIYAMVESKEGGLYRSDDGGENWIRMNDDGRLRQRAWYFSHIFADPKSADTVYVLNTGMFRSTDGGRTFNLLPAPHGDHHGLWIDPDNPDHMINGNDGGATVSLDGGHTWSTQYNQPTAQFYHVITDNRFPYYIYGAQQDNSTIAIKSYDDDGVIGRQDWYAVGGGESGYIAPYPPDPDITFANGEAFASRFDKRTEQIVDISVWPVDYSGNGAEKLPHRYNWTSPLLISPHDPNTLYTAMDEVFKSTDAGQSWTAISGDLTRNDKSKQKPSGGPITLDITSVEYYDTIFAVAESPVKKDMIWVGTDDGLVQLTTDGGAHWNNVTPKDMPDWSLVSIVEPSHYDANTAYIAVDRHKLDDVRPMIFRTRDAGKTWILIANGIPEGSYVRSVREDPKRKGLLFAGTETGVYFSIDDGGHWQPLKLNLPTVPIHDLEVHGDDLIAATHGRSFWVLDDITPLRQVDTATANTEMLLYKPETEVRLHLATDIDRRGPVGDDPPPGAIFDYYFKTAPKDEVKLEIFDSSGKLVRSLSSKEKKGEEQPPEWPDQVKEVTTIPASAGMNRYAWNLRWEPPVKIPGAFYSDQGPQGPLAQPGQYTAKLTIGRQSQTQPFEIVLDPRVKNVKADDLQKQFDLAVQVNDANIDLHRAVNQIRTLRGEIKSLQQRFDNDANMKSLLDHAAELDKKMTPVEEQLIQVNMKGSEANLAFPNMLNEQFDSLSSVIQAGDGAPTQQQYEAYKMLRGKLDQQLAAWKQIMASDVPAFNEFVKGMNVPALYLPEEHE